MKPRMCLSCSTPYVRTKHRAGNITYVQYKSGGYSTAELLVSGKLQCITPSFRCGPGMVMIMGLEKLLKVVKVPLLLRWLPAPIILGIKMIYKECSNLYISFCWHNRPSPMHPDTCENNVFSTRTKSFFYKTSWLTQITAI